MTPEDAVKNGGWYSAKKIDDLNWRLEHFATSKCVDVQIVPDGAFIVTTINGRFHWTGHDLSKGLREADEYLTKHNRKR